MESRRTATSADTNSEVERGAGVDCLWQVETNLCVCVMCEEVEVSTWEERFDML